MPSKSEKALRSFKIPISDITACFKPFVDPKHLILTSTPNPDDRKRKLDDLEISPTDSSSELMSESKKVKFDSPDDMFLNDPSSVHDIKPLVSSDLGVNSNNLKNAVPSMTSQNPTTNGSTDSSTNIWDWNYWENL
ncbi:mediator complex subunit [Kluyveromyces marxianus]|nr:mediator complex subunit [Kluyveromyces marxianus]